MHYICNTVFLSTNESLVVRNKFKIMKQLLFLCISAILVVCLVGCTNNEEPTAKLAETENSESNSSQIRTPEEAAKIAINAYNNFFGEDVESRSQDLSVGSVSAIPSYSSSRSVSAKLDTCLYVVNFENNCGFSLIAANKQVNPVMAITNQGYYLRKSGAEYNGVDLFVDYAIAFLKFNLLRVDNSEYEIGEFTPNIGESDSDYSTLLKNYEREDTTWGRCIPPQIKHTWGQSGAEGSLFENGLAGCSTISIAQLLLCYSSYVDCDTSFNWDLLKQHKRDLLNQENGTCGTDSSEHTEVANYCREIGTELDVTCQSGGTSASIDKMKSLLQSWLPNCNINGWNDYNSSLELASGSNLILVGTDGSNEACHAWLADGQRSFVVNHYLYTQESGGNWDVYQTSYSCKYFHYNWGWYGNSNGWYFAGVFRQYNYNSYNFAENVKYLMVTK
jgi:hypothetical protein